MSSLTTQENNEPDLASLPPPTVSMSKGSSLSLSGMQGPGGAGGGPGVGGGPSQLSAFGGSNSGPPSLGGGAPVGEFSSCYHHH